MNLNQPKGFLASRISPGTVPIQQIKAAGATFRGATTQGLPLPVNNVSVTVSKTGDVNDSRTIRVSFTENPHDPYFTYANLYIKQGNNNPTLVATGTSPIIVTIPKSSIPAVVSVASSGNWGSWPILKSPGKAVSLA